MLLLNDLPEAEKKNNILNKREHILSIIKYYIDNSFDPRKHNMLNTLTEDFEKILSIKDILAKLGFTEDQYYNAAFISSDSDFQTHIKQASNACFVKTFPVKDYNHRKQTVITNL